MNTLPAEPAGTLIRKDFEQLHVIGRALLGRGPEARRLFTDAILPASLVSGDRVELSNVAFHGILGAARKLSPVDLEIQNSFFRLSVPERLTLVGLHNGKWTYRKTAAALGLRDADVGPLSFSARTKLVPVALGPRGMGPECPDFLAMDPWTARFLDHEVLPSSRVFLESHLAKCENCRDLLNRTRELFSQVQDILDRALSEPPSETVSFVDRTWQVWVQTRSRHLYGGRDFVTGLRKFLRKWDVQVVVWLLIALAAYALT